MRLIAALALLGVFVCAAHAQGLAPPNQVLAGPSSGGASDTPKPRALVGADLPNPSASTLGGVESITCAAHQWLNTISIAGVPVCSQPGFSDLSGQATLSQFPNIATSTVIGNFSGSTVPPSAASVPSCPNDGAHAITNNSGNGFNCTAILTATVTVAPGGRLTLASGVPVMSSTSCGGSPCSSQGTIYYDSYVGSTVPYYNGSTVQLETIAGGEVSTAMQTSGTGVLNANDVFDVWWVHSGANRICVATNGSGAGWSGDTGGSLTARGTGYTQLNRSVAGFPTNANAITHCYNGSTDYGSVAANQATYLGTLATSASAGRVGFYFGTAGGGGSPAFFGLWNNYNRVLFTANVTDTGGGYTYTTATIRQARASAGNQIQFVFGVAEDMVQATYFSWVVTAAATNAIPEAGVGLDATNAFSCFPSVVFAPSNLTYLTAAPATCNLQPGAGLHTISANEKGDGTNANTFQDNGTSLLSAVVRM